MVGLIIYLVIGVVYNLVNSIYYWKTVTELRKERHEAYIHDKLEIESKGFNKSLEELLLLCISDVSPWALDYLPIIIGGIINVAIYPIDFVVWIIRRTIFIKIKYTDCGLKPDWNTEGLK